MCSATKQAGFFRGAFIKLMKIEQNKAEKKMKWMKKNLSAEKINTKIKRQKVIRSKWYGGVGSLDIYKCVAN